MNFLWINCCMICTNTPSSTSPPLPSPFRQSVRDFVLTRWPTEYFCKFYRVHVCLPVNIVYKSLYASSVRVCKRKWKSCTIKWILTSHFAIVTYSEPFNAPIWQRKRFWRAFIHAHFQWYTLKETLNSTNTTEILGLIWRSSKMRFRYHLVSA